MTMQKVRVKDLEDGIKIFNLPRRLRDVMRTVPFKIDSDLMESGTSSPEGAALFLPAFGPLPKAMIDFLFFSLKEIDIVGTDKIDDMANEGRVGPSITSHNAFVDEDRNAIVTASPEELSISAHGTLLHEFGHIFYRGLSSDEEGLLEQAQEDGERASRNPQTEDVEENFCEAFRVFYEGERDRLPLTLLEVMLHLDERARSAPDYVTFARGESS